MTDDDTITRGELAAALNALNTEPLRRWAAILSLGDPASATREIFAAAQRNREPEYEPGEIYRSPDGRTWFRMRRSAVDPDDTPGWRCCESGTLYNHSWPGRSLRKLVPEGHTAMLLATKLNAIRDLCNDDQGDPCWPHMVKSIRAIIDGEGTCPGGC